MDFIEAAGNDQLTDILQSIEDKLRERGMLVAATGDNKSEVTISFKSILHQGEEGPYLVISISSKSDGNPDSDAWEEISDYVNEKYSDAREALPDEVQAALDDAYGQVVVVNGKTVY